MSIYDSYTILYDSFDFIIILSGGRINSLSLKDDELLEGRAHMLLTHLSISNTLSDCTLTL